MQISLTLVKFHWWTIYDSRREAQLLSMSLWRKRAPCSGARNWNETEKKKETVNKTKATVATELPFRSKQPSPADLESIKPRNELSENQWRGEKKPTCFAQSKTWVTKATKYLEQHTVNRLLRQIYIVWVKVTGFVKQKH